MSISDGSSHDRKGRVRRGGMCKKREACRARWGPVSLAGEGEQHARADLPMAMPSMHSASVLDGVRLDRSGRVRESGMCKKTETFRARWGLVSLAGDGE